MNTDPEDETEDGEGNPLDIILPPWPNESVIPEDAFAPPPGLDPDEDPAPVTPPVDYGDGSCGGFPPATPPEEEEEGEGE